jgi:hypothetical protein
MDGAQFHSPWVGFAGGGLLQSIFFPQAVKP